MVNLGNLFSLTPEDPNQNYVMAPSGTGITPQDESWHVKNAKAIKAKELTNKADQRAKFDRNLDVFSAMNPPVEGEQTTTPPDEINQTPRGESYKPVPTLQPESISVSGKYATNTDGEEKKDKITAAKNAVDQGANWDIWGRLIVGLTPYALEGLFGGGKWMGSAGKGSAEGIKMYEGLDKDRRNEEQKKTQFQLELDRKNKEAADRIAVEQAKMLQPNYTQAKEVVGPDGKPVLATVNTKTGDWKQSDQQVPAKQPSAREQASLKYYDLAKDRFAHQKEMDTLNQQQKYQKEITEGMQGLSATQDYLKNYRNLASFQGDYAKMADAQLPEHLKNERFAVRRLIYSYVVENAGKAQTDSEVRNALSSLGMNITPKTLEELATNPMAWADKLSTNVNPTTIRSSLDMLATQIMAKQKAREAAFQPSVVQKINQSTGVGGMDVKPYVAPPATGTSTIDKVKAARQRLGL